MSVILAEVGFGSSADWMALAAAGLAGAGIAWLIAGLAGALMAGQRTSQKERPRTEAQSVRHGPTRGTARSRDARFRLVWRRPGSPSVAEPPLFRREGRWT